MDFLGKSLRRHTGTEQTFDLFCTFFTLYGILKTEQ